MMFTLKYPTESPTISIECVHGLKEKDISNLLSYLKELISERKGDPVLFDLVDFCREFISSNIPTVECAICLNYFRNEADVYCTTNFHYFHNYCIGEYVNRKRIEYERELLCPLCHAESLSFSEDLINVTRSKENTESCDSSK
ncbi:E3 ubiquitin-protein ligase [Schistosoma japonicum]|nr:E3 ubiquitin-protein ligase [Schistosoma japonicum]